MHSNQECVCGRRQARSLGDAGCYPFRMGLLDCRREPPETIRRLRSEEVHTTSDAHSRPRDGAAAAPVETRAASADCPTAPPALRRRAQLERACFRLDNWPPASPVSAYAGCAVLVSNHSKHVHAHAHAHDMHNMHMCMCMCMHMCWSAKQSICLHVTNAAPIAPTASKSLRYSVSCGWLCKLLRVAVTSGCAACYTPVVYMPTLPSVPPVTLPKEGAKA